ncbi:hypothetical protein [Candidatus Coxiella mudrowiae]|uniref:hypothetical protein n=1 Tax=Candidatus Coxiella mudrowiae TaxID=2054173 RepID=UPI00066210E3|nr:hypothetical protein [Candidatus Coxiella mudrowiae]
MKSQKSAQDTFARYHQAIALEKLCLNRLTELRGKLVNWLSVQKQREVVVELRNDALNRDIEKFKKRLCENTLLLPDNYARQSFVEKIKFILH